MTLPKPIESYASVGVWARGLSEQWGGDPLLEEPEKLRALERFCAFTRRDPDALVAQCFLRRRESGARFGSVVRRQQMADQVRAFRGAADLPPVEARRLQNHVLSFLIHNGVLIQLGIA